MTSMRAEPESKFESEKMYKGGIAILYRRSEKGIEFLVVENVGTGNVSFVSGAQEESDVSETDAILRELHEELHIPESLGEIRLSPTGVRHDFVFNAKKKERAGHHGSYEVFLVDVSVGGEEIIPTGELGSIRWMSADETLQALSFEDLKDVFRKATVSLDQTDSFPKE